MSLALFLGVVFGLSAIISWRLLFPPPPPLSAAVDRLQQRNALAGVTQADEIAEGGDSAVDRLAGAIGQVLISLGLSFTHLEPDLRLVNRTVHQHVSKKVLLGFFGLALPQVGFLMMLLTGSPFPWILPAGASLVLGVLFFFLSDVILRTEANERREAFRHSLGSFLDLVVISLAGGAGVESALRDAATIGEGWAFVRLRTTLEGAALTGQTPWVALSELGEELDISELVELSASISLAGTEGARVRESLATKADSMRAHALSEVESKAQASTERMAVPMVLQLMGFVVLIGYPAVSLVMGG